MTQQVKAQTAMPNNLTSVPGDIIMLVCPVTWVPYPFMRQVLPTPNTRFQSKQAGLHCVFLFLCPFFWRDSLCLPPPPSSFLSLSLQLSLSLSLHNPPLPLHPLNISLPKLFSKHGVSVCPYLPTVAWSPATAGDPSRVTRAINLSPGTHIIENYYNPKWLWLPCVCHGTHVHTLKCALIKIYYLNVYVPAYTSIHVDMYL